MFLLLQIDVATSLESIANETDRQNIYDKQKEVQYILFNAV